MERVQGVGEGRSREELVVEDVLAVVGRAGEGEVLGVACAEELEGVFHDFFAGEFGTGEVVEHEFTMFGEEGAAFGDTVNVC